jgi:hypothetical protein
MPLQPKSFDVPASPACPQRGDAAQWHTDDVLADLNLDGDVGSDGSTPQDHINLAGFEGHVGWFGWCMHPGSRAEQTLL